ncbi:pseudouridine synthase [Spiroplasma taiwanense]|uniref:RNA pseudouridylate synthase n=1 Tax=Spiroplasma taiwanense CT-1 TaxID=1276220 RepID=S5MG18_9MOLU|nr:pseudouridine synthase [Spiroplasma taiwanense]AGR40815.1 ribosomal large subunit pseudouridine synthase C [Spiroplasma taiwanense CT-1]
MTILKVNQNDVNQTIFNFVKKNFKSTKLSIIYKLFRKGKIKINDSKVKDMKLKIQINDIIKIFDSTESVKRDLFEKVNFDDLDIIYEDQNILIVDKNSNIEIHSHVNISVDQKVKSYLREKSEYVPEKENSFVVSHVHRLDKLTKGLVIYAKNKMTLDSLLFEINNKNKIEKFYLVKLPNLNLPEGKISGYIKYDSELQKSIFKEKEFKNSKIVFQENTIIDEKNCIYEIKLLTGRKHQIRAVCSYFKSPIEKDFRYGSIKTKEKVIELIAYKLVFNNFDNHLSYLNKCEFKSKYCF